MRLNPADLSGFQRRTLSTTGQQLGLQGRQINTRAQRDMRYEANGGTGIV
jgi:hypothetical protein